MQTETDREADSSIERSRDTERLIDREINRNTEDKGK